MLEYLRIKNFALLENVEMEFDKSFNVLTGESGSGKSFVIKAILFLLGNKVSSSIVRTGAESASVEGLFVNEQEEIILRREISGSSGRSRFFINDVLSSQESIKEIREDLLLYTSQHAQHKLLQPAFHTSLLDSFLCNEELLVKRDALLQELRICKKNQESLEEKYKALAERKELLEFQQREIQQIRPSVEEEEELESQREEYKNAKTTIESITQARDILCGTEGISLQDMLYELQKALQKIALTREEYKEDIAILEGIIPQLDGIGKKMEAPSMSVSSEEIERIESRLFEFSKLKRMLNRSIAEICDFEKEIAENLSFLDSCELEMKHLKKEELKRIKELQEITGTLTTKRHNGASILSKAIEQVLIPLGFTKECKVIFSFVSQEIWTHCFEDKARITFCPNVGHPAMPLDAIASGGELSRFLLAISSIMAGKSSQSIIFDEVDTGIGGHTLQKVAEQLYSLSKERQLIVITHWSNVAEHAKNHFLVEKVVQEGIATTQVRHLNKEERVKELQRMKGENLG